MFQRLAISLEQKKAGNNSESSLTKSRQIVFYSNQTKSLQKYMAHN